MTSPLDRLLRYGADKLDPFTPAQIKALQASITMTEAGRTLAP